MSRLRELIHEIHRRSLWQVLAIYVGAAWVVFEVVQTLTEGLGLPSWLPSLALILLLVGLPIVLATAFVQEGLPAVQRDRDPTLLPEARERPGRRMTAVEPSGPWRFLTWRNAIAGGIIALALWGLAAAGWLLFAPGSRAPAGEAAPGVSPNRIAVFPFSVHAPEEFGYLGDGIVNLLSTKLDGAGELAAVDPRGLLSAVRKEGDGPPAPETARSIARGFGAGTFVLGDIVEAGGRLQLDAALYDVAGDLEPKAAATAVGEPAAVFDMVDRLAAELMAGRDESPGARMRQIAAITTASLPALKAYLAGESELLQGRFDQALESFRTAVAADTGFALAYYRLSVTAGWLDRIDLARDAAEAARRRDDRLSERDRDRLEARLAWINGSVQTGERLYRELVGRYPNDVEAWWQLGELLFHSNPQRGSPVSESREPWERVLSLEPDHGPALLHLARIAALERNDAELDSLVMAALDAPVEGQYAGELQQLRTYALQGPEAGSEIRDRLATADDHTVAAAVWNVGAFGLDLRAARDLARLLTDPTRSPSVRALGHLDLAHIELALGRWREAREALDSLQRLNPAAGLQYRALLATVPWLQPTDVQLRELRASLSQIERSDPGTGVPVYVSPDSAAQAQIQAHLLGRLSARLGDREAALQAAVELPTLEGPPATQALAHNLAREIRAELAWQAGDAEGVLAELQGSREVVWHNLATNSGFYSGSHERYLHAEALRALGADADAVHWYETFAGHSIYDLIYLAPSHLARAELYEGLDQPDVAAWHYREFVGLWQNADPQLQPLVDRAKARLQRLDGRAAP